MITAAEFHPLHCNNFMYSSSKGTIKLADMRDSALCDRHAKRACSAQFSQSRHTHSLTHQLTLLRHPTCRIRRGGGPNKPVVLLGDYLVDLRRQVQPGRALHPVA